MLGQISREKLFKYNALIIGRSFETFSLNHISPEFCFLWQILTLNKWAIFTEHLNWHLQQHSKSGKMPCWCTHTGQRFQRENIVLGTTTVCFSFIGIGALQVTFQNRGEAKSVIFVSFNGFFPDYVTNNYNTLFISLLLVLYLY